MRSKTATNVYYASRLSCLGIIFTTILAVAGCGGSSGTTGGNTTTTATLVTALCSPNTVNPSQTSNCNATVQGQNNPTQVVIWTASPTTAGAITPAGVFTAFSGITTTTTATVTACSTVPNYTTVCGSTTITINPVAVAPPTATLTPSATSVTQGSSLTLAIVTTNASTCTASSTDGSWSGTVPCSGTVTVTPTTTTGSVSYLVTVTGSGGSVTASSGTITVTAKVAPPTATLTPSATSVTPGSSLTLTIATTNADKGCTISASDGSVSGNVTCNGTDVVKPTATSGSVKYTVTANGSGGTVTASTTITITATAPPVPTISATPAGPLTQGQSTVIAWNAGTGTSDTVSGPGLTASTLTGNASVTPPTGADTYTITATNAGGSASASVTVTVNAPAPTATLTCTPTSVTLGNPVSCTIATTNATQVIASSTDGSWTGSVTLNGTVSVTPTSTSGSVTYSINVTGSGGSATASSGVITVTNPAITLTSISPVAQWCVGQCGSPAFFFNGTNFAAGQKTVCTPDPNIQTVQLISSTQLNVILGLGGINEGSGYRSCKVCKGDGTGCSASVPLGLYSQNMCASATSGETFCLNPQETVAGKSGNGYVDKFTAAGIPDGKFFVGATHCCIAVDDLTGFVLVDKTVYAEDGVSGSPEPQFQSGPVVANSANNGIISVLQPTAPNNVSFASITGPIDSMPTATSTNVGTNPQSIAVVVTEGKTYVDVLTAGSAPALWSVDTTNATNIVSQPLTGVTANLPGGSAITVFDSLGVGIVTSFGDNLAIPFSLTTLKPTGNAITLPGVPVSAVADTVNGIAVIGNADQPNAGGTLTEVNPTTGTATLVPTVETTVLPVGTVPATTGKGFLVCPQDGVSPCNQYTLP